MNFVLNATFVQELLLVDAHECVAVDARVQHVVGVHRILLTERLFVMKKEWYSLELIGKIFNSAL